MRELGIVVYSRKPKKERDMNDEYTGKKVVSPLDSTSPEKAVIEMLSNLGMTGDEASSWLRNLGAAIDAPGFNACTELLRKPLSSISGLIEL
jgi:hypothetical protein